MTKVLAIILILLLYIIGGERGIITSISLCFNIIVLSVSIVLMSWGWNPVIVTFISCIFICSITFFYQNGKNAKTIASFWSVIAVLLILFAISYYYSYAAHLGGINEIMQREDELLGLSPDINISMAKIAVCMIITGLIGAAMDASIAVSSAVYEVFRHNRDLSMMELYRSGTHIGSDILGATINTLYFACLGEALSLFLIFKNYHYSFLEVINSKAFFQEFTYITISCISCILVIPLTSIVISYILKNPEKLKKHLEEDALFADLHQKVEKKPEKAIETEPENNQTE